MRDFLKDKKIVGAMLVSRNDELLDITIPNMMKWCDWALILMDNESYEVVNKVYKLNKKYKGRLFLRRSSFPHKILTRRGDIQDYRRRWRNLDGHVRDEIFMNLNNVDISRLPADVRKTFRQLQVLHAEKKIQNRAKDDFLSFVKIDILLLPDSDEIFTDYLPELLERFSNSNFMAIKTKPIDIVGSMKTIKRQSMSHHVHILKYHKNYRGWPKQYFAMYKPLGPGDCMRATYYSVHLPYLNKKIVDFRLNNWKGYTPIDEPVWDLDKDVTKLSPDEIIKILKTESTRKMTL